MSTKLKPVITNETIIKALESCGVISTKDKSIVSLILTLDASDFPKIEIVYLPTETENQKDK